MQNWNTTKLPGDSDNDHARSRNICARYQATLRPRPKTERSKLFGTLPPPSTATGAPTRRHGPRVDLAPAIKFLTLRHTVLFPARPNRADSCSCTGRGSARCLPEPAERITRPAAIPPECGLEALLLYRGPSYDRAGPHWFTH